MGRRTVLLIVAAVVAALGTSLVFMYVRGVEAREADRYNAVEVLQAVEVINAGESLKEAQAAGKIRLGNVAEGQLLQGASTSIAEVGDEKVALTTVYPGEQIVTSKFGSAGDQEVLTIPDSKMAISVELTDPARVAGFVNPGADVAVFFSAEPEVTDLNTGKTTKLPKFTRMLLPRVQVIGVGATTVVPTVTTDEEGTQTSEEIPRTLLTLAVDQAEAEKVIFAAKNGELAFALLTDDSSVKAGPGVTAADFIG